METVAPEIQSRGLAERVCWIRAQVIRQMRPTVFHEVGHHSGLEEDDLANLSYE